MLVIHVFGILRYLDKPLSFTIPVGMVSLQVRCDGSQVWCVTFYPRCDPCYALAIEDSEDEPEVLEVPDVITVDSDDSDEEPEVIKLEVPDVKTDKEELCL